MTRKRVPGDLHALGLSGVLIFSVVVAETSDVRCANIPPFAWLASGDQMLMSGSTLALKAEP